MTAKDEFQPVYCSQCHKHIPRALLTGGICVECQVFNNEGPARRAEKALAESAVAEQQEKMRTALAIAEAFDTNGRAMPIATRYADGSLHPHTVTAGKAVFWLTHDGTPEQVIDGWALKVEKSSHQLPQQQANEARGAIAAISLIAMVVGFIAAGYCRNQAISNIFSSTASVQSAIDAYHFWQGCTIVGAVGFALSTGSFVFVRV